MDQVEYRVTILSVYAYINVDKAELIGKHVYQQKGYYTFNNT